MDIVDHARFFLVSFVFWSRQRTHYLSDTSLSSLYILFIQYINVSSSFMIFQLLIYFLSTRWVQGMGKGYSLWWMKMYVCLAKTTDNHVTRLQISSWALVMWKVIFSWLECVASFGIDKSLMNQRNSRHTNTRIYYHACFSMRASSYIVFTFRYWGLGKLGYIPICMLVPWIYLRPKYHWTQILVRIALMFLTVQDKRSVRGFWSALAVLDYLLFLILWLIKTILHWIEQREMDSWLLVRHFMASVCLTRFSTFRIFWWTWSQPTQRKNSSSGRDLSTKLLGN